MARISPLPSSELGALNAQLEAMVDASGFAPNSLPTMARIPGLAEAFGAMAKVVLSNPALPADLLQMVAHTASMTAGCSYCSAHTAHNAESLGVSEEKISDLWIWNASEFFDDSEKLALQLAADAASVPNTVTDEQIEELKEHFTDDQIAGLVAVISLFGFLNRWNDTLSTDLEDQPKQFAQEVLSPQGWT